MTWRSCLILALLVLSALAQQEPKPQWLDTIAPVVTIAPQERYQSAIFHISFTTDERARIWFRTERAGEMEEYTNPVTIVAEGTTIVFYYAEDDVGNKTSLDSAVYVLDTKPPRVQVDPPSGLYDVITTVRFTSDEHVKFFFHKDSTGEGATAIAESVVVSDSLVGYVTAQDRAGNRTVSDFLKIIVDTSTVEAFVTPEEGLFNSRVEVSFDASPGAVVYYTMDPLAPTKWFKEYTDEFRLPHGLTLLRYFAQSRAGKKSDIQKASFVVDTIPPKIRGTVTRGSTHDQVKLSTKETSVIFWSSDEHAALDSSQTYRGPISVRRKGRGYVKALAKDRAGNLSELYVWEYRYDKTPPTVTPSHRSGTYTRPFTLHFKTSEPAEVLYAVDADSIGKRALKYSEGIQISKSGMTKIMYVGVDEAGNRSKTGVLEYVLDVSAPEIKEQIDGNVGKDNFLVSLLSNEPVKIYYEIGDKTPGPSSRVYAEPIEMRAGQVLTYIAIDSVGNRSDAHVMDDLKRPLVQALPKGGTYTSQIGIGLTASMSATVYYRIPPDTAFVEYQDSIRFLQEGVHRIEYYCETKAEVRSPIRREEYLLDWTPPTTEVTVKQGAGDTVIVFFDCSENATVYYTTDGSSPSFSPTVKVASNKYFRRSDRLKMVRRKGRNLAFYAEDLAGNQSSITVLDFFNPRPVPSVPAGPGIKYNRLLSLSLNTFDSRSVIYYERHGKTPTTNSPEFTAPIPLLKSDTIFAFVMDASGYKGDIDTFIYHIDLPPAAQFVFSPGTASVDQEVAFDASLTADNENPHSRLRFAWDFNSDGTPDVEGHGRSMVSHTFRGSGWHNVTLNVVDTTGRISSFVKKVFVRGTCPEDMAFVAMPDGHAYCIDTYESPNKAGVEPRGGVSWIQANMSCLDQGKRLCTAEEWKHACNGGSQTAYPYGDKYDQERCATHTESIQKSGSFPNCGEGFGVSDMVGNVWEWVADRDGNRAVMAGGTHTYKGEAHCGLLANGTIVTGNKNVGFRCCR